MANYDMGSLVASIQLDVSGLRRDISNATSAFSNLGSQIGNLATAITSLESRLAGMSSGMRGVASETRNTGSALSSLAERIKNTQSSFDSFTSGAMGKVRALTTDLFFLQMSAQQISSAFQFAFGQGIAFSAKMEDSVTGMAAIISSSLTLDGKDITFAQGMTMARGAVDELKKAALSTNVSLEELMGVFQALIGPASNLGMSFQEITQFSVFGANAVKAMGLKKDQLVQELRSIVTGNITERSSTVATALGITNEDVANAKNQAGGLFKFLTDRMAGYVMASRETEGHLTSIWSNIMDGIQQTQAVAFEGLFNTLKTELQEIQNLFFTIKRDESGKIISAELNQETVESFRTMAVYTEMVYEDLKEWATNLAASDEFMSRIYTIMGSISSFVGFIYDNFASIAGDLALIFAISGGWLRLITTLTVYFDAIPEVLQFVKDHLTEILIFMALWAGYTSPLATSLLKIGEIILNNKVFLLGLLEGAWNLVRAIWTMEAATVAAGGAFESLGVIGTTVLASLTAGAILLAGAIGAAIFALYKMKGILDEAKAQTTEEERGDLAGAAGSGSLEGDYLPRQREADIGMDDYGDAGLGKKRYRETRAEKMMREMREKQEEAHKKTQEDLAKLGGVTASKFGAGDTGKAPKAGRGAGDAVRAEMAEIEGALKEKNAAIKDILDELKYEYQEHDISIKTYFTEAAELTQQLTFNEINALNQKIAVATKESDVVKYQAELKLKMQQMNKEQIKLLREEAKALKDLDKTLSDYAATAAERSGDFAKAAEIKVNKQYEDVLKGFNAEIITYEANLDSLSVAEKARLVQLKDAVKTIGDIIVSTKTKGALDTINLEQKTAENAQAARKVALDKQLKEGLISEIEYKQKIIDSNNEYANTIEALIPKLEALSLKEGLSATEKQEYAAAITTLKGKLVELREPLSAVAKQVKSDFVDTTSSAFEGLIMQTKSVSEAFQDMAKSILASIAKIAAQRAASSIANSLFSIFGGGTNTATAGISSGYYTGTLGSTNSWSTAFSHADGGQITGPGTSTSDSIPAMLSNGEFVIRAASVSKIGKNALEYINNFGSLPKLHYAEGGMVGNAGTSSGLSTIKINVINQTGTPVQAKADIPTFNGVEQVMNLWLTGVNSNVLQSRDVLKSMAKG